MDAYTQLEAQFARIADIDGALAILGWDRAAMMPRGGAETRARQLATLQSVSHDLLVAPEVGGWLDRAEAEEWGTLGPWQQANLREMRRQHSRAVAVSNELIGALTRARSRCEMVWREAKPANDFNAVRPHLEEVLGLSREVARARAEALGCTPYDACLDSFDPGLRAARLEPIFAELAAFLPGFLEQVLERQGRAEAPLPLQGEFPVARQKQLCEKLMRTIGFDFEHGRLDRSAHPFCGGVSGDVRITTRYETENPTRSLMAVSHEVGHALYNLNLPREWATQPVGRARGMTIHESQSLAIEMQACRSRAFIAWLAPRLRDHFEVEGPRWEAANILALATRVERSHIRVNADEVTYPAHIILRYRLERAMIDGELAVADLPEAWAAQMQDLLGFAPPTDRLGCLQDIHWYDGSFGYFPTYTLGALTAAQLYAAALEACPEIPERLRAGDFTPLARWMQANIHSQARLYDTENLIERASGARLGTEAFKAHLARRYLGEGRG